MITQGSLRGCRFQRAATGYTTDSVPSRRVGGQHGARRDYGSVGMMGDREEEPGSGFDYSPLADGDDVGNDAPKRRRSGSSSVPGPAAGTEDKPKTNHNVKIILVIVLLAGLSESIGFGATLTAYLYMATGDEVGVRARLCVGTRCVPSHRVVRPMSPSTPHPFRTFEWATWSRASV